MKKIMTLMLGLSLVLGTSAFAADEHAKGDATEKKAKKKGSKKADEKKEEKK